MLRLAHTDKVLHGKELQVVAQRGLALCLTGLCIKLHERCTAVFCLCQPPQTVCGLVKLHGLAVVAHSHSRIHTGVCHGAGLGGSVDARDFNLVEHTSSGGHAHGVETSVVGSECEDQRWYGGHVLQLEGCTVDS